MGSHHRASIVTVWTIVSGIVLFARSMTTFAQAPEGKSLQESAETTRLISAELPSWKFWKGTEAVRELTLQPKSVLRWTNPGTGRVYGDLYLWTRDGRPEVAMTLFKAWEPANGFHVELQSLAIEPIVAERNQKVVWNPNQPGVVLKPVADAPKPADTPVRRLIQMRALAEQFSATLTDFRQNQTGENQALRLLPQPIYRYQSTNAELIDGAMFVFVLGTDPEVFLLLEHRQDQGTALWNFALGRMNNDPFLVKHNGKEIWRAERAESRDEMRDAYVLKMVPESP